MSSATIPLLTHSIDQLLSSYSIHSYHNGSALVSNTSPNVLGVHKEEVQIICFSHMFNTFFTKIQIKLGSLFIDISEKAKQIAHISHANEYSHLFSFKLSTPI